MPREIPDAPKDWKSPQPGSGRVRSYEIELITPMFGGGVITRECDTTFPIRPTAIRGQLQFWWRATVGARCESTAELRREQTRVWGNTERASCVQVRVDVLKVDPSTACATFDRDNRDSTRYRSMPTWNAPFTNTALPYALFPFQGQLGDDRRSIKVPPASHIPRANFRLTITFNNEIDFARDVEPALWAWVNFGGLGSRTRRGCGALVCKALAPKDKDDLTAMWLRYMPTLFPRREWPTMAEAILTDRDHPTAISAWDRVIRRFQYFRQGEGLGRDPGSSPKQPGRSRWPEPETIRRISGRRGRSVPDKLTFLTMPSRERSSACQSSLISRTNQKAIRLIQCFTRTTTLYGIVASEWPVR